MEYVNFLFRWSHLLFGITWIGLLYYFNFVQGGYFKSASPEGLSDAKAKLAPSALWWFRWGAMVTFLSGIILIHLKMLMGIGIMIGAALGTLMFLNVWLIIWPNQKIVIASAQKVLEGGEADAATPLQGFWSLVVASAAQQSLASGEVILIDEFCAGQAITLPSHG